MAFTTVHHSGDASSSFLFPTQRRSHNPLLRVDRVVLSLDPACLVAQSLWFGLQEFSFQPVSLGGLLFHLPSRLDRTLGNHSQDLPPYGLVDLTAAERDLTGDYVVDPPPRR